MAREDAEKQADEWSAGVQDTRQKSTGSQQPGPGDLRDSGRPFAELDQPGGGAYARNQQKP